MYDVWKKDLFCDVGLGCLLEDDIINIIFLIFRYFISELIK